MRQKKEIGDSKMNSKKQLETKKNRNYAKQNFKLHLYDELLTACSYPKTWPREHP